MSKKNEVSNEIDIVAISLRCPKRIFEKLEEMKEKTGVKRHPLIIKALEKFLKDNDSTKKVQEEIESKIIMNARNLREIEIKIDALSSSFSSLAGEIKTNIYSQEEIDKRIFDVASLPLHTKDSYEKFTKKIKESEEKKSDLTLNVLDIFEQKKTLFDETLPDLETKNTNLSNSLNKLSLLSTHGDSLLTKVSSLEESLKKSTEKQIFWTLIVVGTLAGAHFLIQIIRGFL